MSSSLAPCGHHITLWRLPSLPGPPLAHTVLFSCSVAQIGSWNTVFAGIQLTFLSSVVRFSPFPSGLGFQGDIFPGDILPASCATVLFLIHLFMSKSSIYSRRFGLGMLLS